MHTNNNETRIYDENVLLLIMRGGEGFKYISAQVQLPVLIFLVAFKRKKLLKVKCVCVCGVCVCVCECVCVCAGTTLPR